MPTRSIHLKSSLRCVSFVGLGRAVSILDVEPENPISVAAAIQIKQSLIAFFLRGKNTQKEKGLREVAAHYSGCHSLPPPTHLFCSVNSGKLAHADVPLWNSFFTAFPAASNSITWHPSYTTASLQHSHSAALLATT